MKIDPVILEACMEEFIKHNPGKENTDYTKDGECSHCGSCCSNRIPMTELEVGRLRKLVRRKKIKPRTFKTIFDEPGTLDMTCPFLEREGGCLIYNDRPLMCKLFRCNKPQIEMFKELSEIPDIMHQLQTRYLRQEIFGEGI